MEELSGESWGTAPINLTELPSLLLDLSNDQCTLEHRKERLCRSFVKKPGTANIAEETLPHPFPRCRMRRIHSAKNVSTIESKARQVRPGTRKLSWLADISTSPKRSE